MNHAYIILTDFSGVQKEAPAFGKPVLVLCDETARPETVEQGVVKLVQPNYEDIMEDVQRSFHDKSAYQSIARGVPLYGDGNVAERMVKTLREYFS